MNQTFRTSDSTNPNDESPSWSFEIGYQIGTVTRSALTMIRDQVKVPFPSVPQPDSWADAPIAKMQHGSNTGSVTRHAALTLRNLVNARLKVKRGVVNYDEFDSPALSRVRGVNLDEWYRQNVKVIDDQNEDRNNEAGFDFKFGSLDTLI